MRAWQGDVLILMPAQTSYSVWWFFEEGVFSGGTSIWRSPMSGTTTRCRPRTSFLTSSSRRNASGGGRTPTSLIAASATLSTSTGPRPKRSGPAGERLIKVIEAGDFPFDGTHTGFRPDPGWPVPRLSDGLA